MGYGLIFFSFQLWFFACVDLDIVIRFRSDTIPVRRCVFDAGRDDVRHCCVMMSINVCTGANLRGEVCSRLRLVVPMRESDQSGLLSGSPLFAFYVQSVQPGKGCGSSFV